MATHQDNPPLGMCFEISANGASLGSFSECSGLAVEIESESYKEGGSNDFTYKLPVHATTRPVVLKRGLEGSNNLWEWISTYAKEFRVEPRRVLIQLRSPDSPLSILRSWTLDHAYPLKWEGPKLDATRGEVAFESVELAHRGVQLGSNDWRQDADT